MYSSWTQASEANELRCRLSLSAPRRRLAQAVAAAEAAEEGVQKIIQEGFEGLQEGQQGGTAKRMGLVTIH